MNTVRDIPNRVWQPEAECISRDELSALQIQRLRDTLIRTAHVPFYKGAFATCGFSAQDLTQLSDIRKLPLTTKADLRDHYPLGFLAVSRDQVERYHGSSGTTGKPTFVAYSRRDIET